MSPNLSLLMILDGVGVTKLNKGNAVALANTQTLEKLWSSFPHTYLHAAEEQVGLPKGVNGNSEVGHTNIGAGKVVYQSLLRINRSIQKNALATNQTIIKTVKFATDNKSRIHLLCLLSDGGVHSHIDHLLEIIKTIKTINKTVTIYIHVITDGRDVPVDSSKKYIDQLLEFTKSYSSIFLATLIGRYYAMDRDQRWDRTQLAYDLMTQFKGEQTADWKNAINKSYQAGVTDEFIKPIAINPNGIVTNNDSVIFLNFRSDRACQLTEAFINPNFTGFIRQKIPENLFFTTMMLFSKKLKEHSHLIFPRNTIALPLGRVISENGLSQLRISESEKYPHVTYFFNGGQNLIYDLEDRIEIPSPKNIATYDQKPEMNAVQLTNKILEKIDSQRYQFMVVNYANPDMVAHTGNLQASIKAMEVIDRCVNKIVRKVLSVDGQLIITSDHGNIEELINLETDQIDTEHSTNLVPFILVSKKYPSRFLPIGSLSDIAPTMLSLMGLSIPEDMTGNILIK